MNSNVHPPTGLREGSPLAARPTDPSAAPPSSHAAQLISVGRSRALVQEAGKEADLDIFTVSLGDEKIQLLPFRNWSQLDVHKWTVRGKLPGSPAGLDIAHDHVKLLGESVSTKDSDGCARLAALFNEWVALEKETLETARKKESSRPRAAGPAGAAKDRTARFHVDLDKTGQVHIQRFEGAEIVGEIGLNAPGLNGLCSSGFMRKPRKVQVGVLHDWIELDGELFSFEKGKNDAARLEQALNAKYLPDSSLGHGKDVIVTANAASSTGFDIQFPVSQAGVLGTRKRPLNEDSLALLQDPNACGVLHKAIVIKLARPSLVFKLRTPDGGERYLDRSPEHTVTVAGDDGSQKLIDLSQPVNYLRLSPVELTAVFNHPAINQHSQAAPTLALSPPPPPPAHPPGAAAPPPAPDPVDSAPAAEAPPAPPPPSPPAKPAARPNAWMESLLAQPAMRHDWLASMVYTKIAQKCGTSRESKLGLSNCWAVALSNVKYAADPGFKGVFLTEKRGFGFICRGQMVRLNNGAVFVGTQESAIQGLGVNLVGVGIDCEQRIVLIVSDNYRRAFGVAEPVLNQELGRLAQNGAVIIGVKEVLTSPTAIEALWTVPTPKDPTATPEVIETFRPPEP